jgi:hypothetical protein
MPETQSGHADKVLTGALRLGLSMIRKLFKSSKQVLHAKEVSKGVQNGISTCQESLNKGFKTRLWDAKKSLKGASRLGLGMPRES